MNHMEYLLQNIRKTECDPWWLSDDKEVFDEIEHPNFNYSSPAVHMWESYVPEYIQQIWGLLSMETKLIVFAICEREAQNEEWN